ncbi:MAG: hypothetical protein ACE5JK_02745, partial [Candidatus Omnitrophota bacterium]
PGEPADPEIPEVAAEAPGLNKEPGEPADPELPEAAAAAPRGPSQEVLAKKAALEAQKAIAADARFTRKRQRLLDAFGRGRGPDDFPLKGPR